MPLNVQSERLRKRKEASEMGVPGLPVELGFAVSCKEHLFE